MHNALNRFSRYKFLSSFAALNITQFLTALNDNIYKLLLIFLLIHLKGPQASNMILALAGAIFVVPFLLFASLAGTLADRFSKSAIIKITRLTEIVVVSLAVLAIWAQSPIGGYAVLFLMSTQSAIFSPCKYGILPEIVKKEKISHYNGVMTATTYLAIIVGTFLASLLADLTHKNYTLSSLVCLVVALLGAFFSLQLESTLPQAKDKKVSPRFISDILRTLKKAKQIRYLLLVLVFGSYFLFMGAYVQLNIIPFTIQSLHSSEIQGGYLFLMTAIGIGMGSFLSGRLSGKSVELGFVPLAALGISVALALLFFFHDHFYSVVLILVILGMLGGFYIVPIDAYIQIASPSSDRGQNVAASNFLNFLGVIFASVLIALLGEGLSLSAAQGFFVVACLTLLVALLLFFAMADQIVRLFVAKMASLFWDLTVHGEKNLSLHDGYLIVAQRRTWLDTVVIMATLPRTIRYVVPYSGHFPKIRELLYRILALVPIDLKSFTPSNRATMHLIHQELREGHPVTLMLPALASEWEEKLKTLAVPIVPVTIQRNRLKERRHGFFSLFKTPIKISYGKAEI